MDSNFDELYPLKDFKSKLFWTFTLPLPKNDLMFSHGTTAWSIE